MLPIFVTLLGALLVLSLFNLALNLGLARRLRQETGDIWARLSPGEGDRAIVSPGEVVDMSRILTAYSELNPVLASAEAPFLVGFFSDSCEECVHHAPDFLTAADKARERGVPVVVAIADLQAAAGRFAVEVGLDSLPHVFAETLSGPLIDSFKVWGFPAYAWVDPAGRIVASGHILADAQKPVLAELGS